MKIYGIYLYEEFESYWFSREKAEERRANLNEERQANSKRTGRPVRFLWEISELNTED